MQNFGQFSRFCGKCGEFTISSTSRVVSNNMLTTRNISTTVPLQRFKRQQRRYRPPVPEFNIHGQAHRLMRGKCVLGERYGPLVELPDYTYLDGRPTPLTPTQLQLEQERKHLASKVVNQLQEMDNMKKFIKEYAEEVKEEREGLKMRRLKPKNL